MRASIEKKVLSRSLILGGCGIFLCFASGCYLFKKKDKPKRPTSFIEHESVQFDRDKTNREASTLRFNLKGNGSCSLKVWPQERNTEEALDKAPSIPCRSSQPNTKFIEQMAEFRTDTLYAVEISAWPKDSTPQNAERFVAYESPGDGWDRNLVGFHANLPLQVAKLRRIKSDDSTLAEIYQLAKPIEGCLAAKAKTGASTPAFYEQPSDAIESLSLSGQIDAETMASKDNSVILFNGTDADEPLHIKVAYADGKDELNVGRLGRFATLKIEEPEVNELATSKKMYLNKTVPIGAGDALRLSWTTTQESRQSFVKISVEENEAGENGFSCFFNAALHAAKIPYTPFLRNLKKGIHQIIVSFVYQSVSLFKSPAIWFVSAQDWRSFRLERI